MGEGVIGPRVEDMSPQMGEVATGVWATKRDAAADCPSLGNEINTTLIVTPCESDDHFQFGDR